MINEIKRWIALGIIMLAMLPLSALAIECVWPEGEQPTPITRWWVNAKLQWGDNFLILVFIVGIIGVSLLWLLISICRHRKAMMLFRKEK